MGFDFMLEELLETVGEIPKGQTFTARSLIKGTEWEALPRGDRIRFGKYFKLKVKNGEIPNVKYIGKANSNSAQYMKK